MINAGSCAKSVKNLLFNTNINLKNEIADEVIMKFNLTKGINEYYDKSKQFYNENLLLLTHPSYTIFPFEANINLRERSVYRLPSFQYVI